jgi:hypothetical protein
MAGSADSASERRSISDRARRRSSPCPPYLSDYERFCQRPPRESLQLARASVKSAEVLEKWLPSAIAASASDLRPATASAKMRAASLWNSAWSARTFVGIQSHRLANGAKFNDIAARELESLHWNRNRQPVHVDGGSIPLAVRFARLGLEP